MHHNEYDFDDQLISQRIPVIQVPNFQPLISSRAKMNKLDNQTLRNIEIFLQQSKNKEIQRIQLLKNKQKFIGEEVQKQQRKKEKKRKQISEKQKQKALKQCTFKPTINNKGERRDLAQFLQTQNDHLKKVQAKKRSLKISIQSEKQKQSFHPKINPNTNKSRKNNQPIYQRLYALKDKQNISNNNFDDYNSQNTFMPVISQKSKKITRTAPIDTLLYGDALRRQQKSKDILYTQSSQTNPKHEKPLNLTNQKYAAQKFIKEYFNVLSTLNIKLSINYQIDYIMFNQVLKMMGFIKEDDQSQDGVSVYERSLVHDAYQRIQKFGVNARNICVFLLGLIGIYHVNLTNFGDQEEEIQQGRNYNLSEIEGRKMQKYFDTLFRNRLNCENIKKYNDNIEINTCSFQPKINKNSEHLAQRYRTQMLEQANMLLQNYPELEYSIPEDGIISHTELLVLNKLARQIQIKKKRQMIENKCMKECTFKPTTLSSLQQTMSNSKMSNFDSKLGQKKSFELYNYHKNQQSKKQSLQVSRQLEDPECTFAPNLKKDKVNGKQTYAKQIDETLYRMHKGRQQKEQKNKFLERGEKKINPNSKNNTIVGSRMSLNTQNYRTEQQALHNQNNESIEQSEQNSRFQNDNQRAPTLILDVNLGDETSRINLFKEDEHRLNEVAHEFALEHGLDQQSEYKLLQMLQIELSSVLGKISQDEQYNQEV